MIQVSRFLNYCYIIKGKSILNEIENTNMLRNAPEAFFVELVFNHVSLLIIKYAL